jgi:hypothetical protein
MTSTYRLPSVAARCGFAVLLLSLAAGCTWGRSQDAKEARTKLVGMSRSELVSCAGKPKTAIRDGDREYLAYFAGSPDYDLVLGVKPNEVQKITGTARPVNCKVRFMLRGGNVESVSYTGNTGGILTRDSACASIVRRCLPPE